MLGGIENSSSARSAGPEGNWPFPRFRPLHPGSLRDEAACLANELQKLRGHVERSGLESLICRSSDVIGRRVTIELPFGHLLQFNELFVSRARLALVIN